MLVFNVFCLIFHLPYGHSPYIHGTSLPYLAHIRLSTKGLVIMNFLSCLCGSQSLWFIQTQLYILLLISACNAFNRSISVSFAGQLIPRPSVSLGLGICVAVRTHGQHVRCLLAFLLDCGWDWMGSDGIGLGWNLGEHCKGPGWEEARLRTT